MTGITTPLQQLVEAATPEPWLAELATTHDVTLAPIAVQANGVVIWACMADCSCLFVVDDTTFLDRFSLVTEDGPCPAYQECNCHAFPRRKPGSEND